MTASGTSSNQKQNRGFGPEVIQMLIPHRRPLLLVDRVESFNLDESPALTACRQITANEEVFGGHFPGWNVWPGVYTIEGLGQSCMILSVLVALEEKLLDAGKKGDDLVKELHNLERGFRLRPGFRPPPSAEALDEILGNDTYFGLSSVYNVKLFHPVFAGQRLDYSVEIARRVGEVKHYEVEAAVEGQPVARGTLGSTSVIGIPRPGGLGSA